MMARSDIARQKNTGCRAKVKTGCTTCRVRKVKCDEEKPFCQRCIKTGRTCDGYESPFRFFHRQPIDDAPHPGSIIHVKSDFGLQPVQPTLSKISPQDIQQLSRYFSIKTIFDVKLGCDEEARQLLQASLTYPPLQYAVSSLKALRQDLETSTDGSTSVGQYAPSYDYGLRHYNMALGGLASNLSSSGFSMLKSALLCCQVFISIEQLLANYAAMIQHIIRGVGIMRECRTRPGFIAENQDQLPLLDVFIIKLFAAPCKFADPPATTHVNETTTLPVCPISSHGQTVGPHNLRTIAPDMRTELTSLATSAIEFLDQASQAEFSGNTLRLRSQKASLLNSLESWRINLDIVHAEMGGHGPEPISVSFLRLFHQILKIIVLGVLDFSPDLEKELQIEHSQLQRVANAVGERVMTYRMRTGAGSDRTK